jgi:hypothetical protein
LSLFQPSVPSTAQRSLQGPLFTLRPSNLSMGFCFLNSPLSPRRHSVSLRPTFLCMAVCLLYRHMSPFKSLCPLLGPLFPSTIFCTM